MVDWRLFQSFRFHRQPLVLLHRYLQLPPFLYGHIQKPLIYLTWSLPSVLSEIQRLSVALSVYTVLTLFRVISRRLDRSQCLF